MLALATVLLAASLELDATKRLFLDDHIVASMDGVTRTIHQAEKHPANPLIWPEEEWEGVYAIVFGSILRENDVWKMWYYGGARVNYAESKDGVNWTKPKLDVIEMDGQKTNLLLLRDTPAAPYFHELFGVLKNPDQSDPARKYLMGILSIQKDYKGERFDPFHRSQRRGLGVLGSPDGIHWDLIDNFATDAICDGSTHWTWDPARERILLYGRTQSRPPALMELWKDDPWFQEHHWGRASARIESPDFLNWNYSDGDTAPVVMVADEHDAVGTEIYGMRVFPYESVYIGLVQRFHNRPDTTYLDLQLAVSHDSINFTRVGDRSPFLPCGGVGDWDRFNNASANNDPIRVGDDLWFYYSGRTYQHGPYDGDDTGEVNGGVGLATIKLDRFVSLDATYAGGTITTKPFLLKGTTLNANLKSNFGEAVVEVLDQSGAVIATSEPLSEDSLNAKFDWAKGGLGQVSGSVTLRFTLKNARLFAFWME
jgi:hypothetical protein